MASDIEITLGLDDKEYNQGIDGVKRSTKRAGEEGGKSIEDNIGKRGSAAFRRLAIAAAAAGAAIGTALFTRASIRAASEQENVTRRLESALLASGQEVDSNRQKIELFAAEIQKTTKLSNEAIESQAAFAIGLGATGDQITSLVGASVELSSALGTSLEGATQRLARTLQGDLSARLAQVIPELRDFTEEQLKAGAAIDFVAQRFSGSAAAEAQTFSGRITQLSESFADLQKSIGQFVTESPAIIGATSALRTAVEAIDRAVQSTDGTFRDFIEGALGKVFLATINLSIKGMITFNNIISNTQTFLDFVADTVLATAEGFNRLNLAAAKAGAAVSRFFGRDQESRNQQISGIERRIELIQLARQAGEEDTRERLEQQDRINQKLLETGDIIRNAFEGGGEGEDSGPFASFNQQLVETSENVETTTTEIEQRFKDLASSFNRIISGGIVRSISLLGANLVEGGNFFKGFTAIALDALGDLLIAFGSGAIATGITAEAIKASIGSLSGGQAIVAGVAAIAAGGALKAFSSSLGGASGGSPSIASNPSLSSDPTITDTREVEDSSQRESGQSVQLVVQGDILDSEDSGRRLVELLNSNFESDNRSLVGARFA